MRKCSNCYFGDKCRSHRVCSNYCQIDLELADEELFGKIEQDRTLYFKAWVEYIDDADFSFE